MSGDRPVSEAGEGVFDIGNFMWVGACFAQQQQDRQSQTRTESQTCLLLVRSTFKKEVSPRQSNEHRATINSIHWGVTFRTARAGSYSRVVLLSSLDLLHIFGITYARFELYIIRVPHVLVTRVLGCGSGDLAHGSASSRLTYWC